MRIYRLITALLLSTLLFSGTFAFYVYHSVNTPVSHDKAAQYITVESGSASNRIIQLLADSNIIQAPLATKLYLKFNQAATSLEAGDYLFPSPVSPVEVLDILRDGKKRTQTLPIPEGWTRFEIARRITARFPADPPVTQSEVLGMMDDVSLIQDFDTLATNLEGYLYPLTYEVEIGTHPRDVIGKMVRQFKSVWQPEWDELARQLGRTRREIVTIASLIENESKIDAERPIIASVIYNRLEQGIPLGIDATNVYIAKMLGRWDGILHKSDLQIDHPYNTRKVYGLPPGPISSASRSAIEAALRPAQTDKIFYVLNVEAGDGSHHFYSTAAGFARGKAAYQKWLARQRE